METKETMIRKLNELSEDERFAESLKNAETYDDASKVMAEFGIDLSGEDLEKMIVGTRNYIAENGFMNDGELTEEGLEMVSGGIRVRGRSYLYMGVEAAAVCAIIGGVAVGPAALACIGVAGIAAAAGFISTLW